MSSCLKDEPAGAEVYLRRGDMGIIIHLGKYTTIMKSKMTDDIAAYQLAIQEGNCSYMPL